MEVQMKAIFAALASASLLISPMAVSLTPGSAFALASHGGGGGFHGGGAPGAHGGGFHGGGARGGGFHGGGPRGGGFHGGGHFHGGGRYRGGYGGNGYDFAAAGLGFALGGAYADAWGSGDSAYYAGYDGDVGPDPGEPQACESWVWDEAQSAYDWVPC
jgi:hypothetical protein